jgi:cytidylate kinase
VVVDGAEAPDPDDLVRVIAVDGPAGSGKSTVAKLAAQALGWRFVDTGATYRAAALKVLRCGVDPADSAAVATAVSTADIVLAVDPRRPGVSLDGEDVSTEIRGAAVTSAVSAVSAVPAVRAQLVDLQRRAMGTGGAVVEGRDIATVVAPRAAVKVYLDARPEVRAQRRAAERPAASEPAPGDTGLLTEVQRALEHRDALDSQTNPLQASDGAVHIDTSELTLPEVVAAVVSLAVQAGLVPAGVPVPGAGAVQP